MIDQDRGRRVPLYRRRMAAGAGLFLAAVLMVAAPSGCTTSPADQQAIRDAWAQRDAERAADCRRHNVGYAAGGCTVGGP